MAQERDEGFESRLGDLWNTRLMCEGRGGLLRATLGGKCYWRKGTEALLCQSALEQVYEENLLQREFHCGREMAQLDHGDSQLLLRMGFPNQLNNLKRSLCICKQKFPSTESVANVS